MDTVIIQASKTHYVLLIAIMVSTVRLINTRNTTAEELVDEMA